MARFDLRNPLAKDGFMAGKPLNRLELRRQSDAAEPLDPMEDESEDAIEDVDDDEAEGKKPKKKPKAPSKAKPKAVKAAKPAARMRIVWTVMNDAFKPVGTFFEYSQKGAAETRAAELTAKGKGTHFVMKSKEPMPDNAPGLGAAIPRAEVAPPQAAVKEAAAAAIEEEDESEEDEESEVEVEEEAEED
jgi:hypothetical protein